MNFNKTTTKFEQSTAPGYTTTFVEQSRSPNLPNYPDYSISSSFSSFMPSPMVLGQLHTYEMTPFAQSGHPQDDTAHSDEDTEQYRESPPLEPELLYMESIALFDRVVMPMDDSAHPLLDSPAPFLQPLPAHDFFTDDEEPLQRPEASPIPSYLPLEPEYPPSLESSDPVACDISLVSSACTVRNGEREDEVASEPVTHHTGKRKRRSSEVESSDGRAEEKREESMPRPTFKRARTDGWDETEAISEMFGRKQGEKTTTLGKRQREDGDEHSVMDKAVQTVFSSQEDLHERGPAISRASSSAGKSPGPMIKRRKLGCCGAATSKPKEEGDNG
ncbi:unnamed protein product [Chondrus crispus]|uniref:Uncharacterized protein n=1 Tax=Chondrus crispus TaxID=2769 RepID=R7Q4Y0_CHOCR|nr:unnamed protein product [Chondrus crispus]CDF33602.1 unnamed protein product [Chondrus crispus]|eukprot:XP_005713405.1 unnamed protein product [Chondrus crispus]